MASRRPSRSALHAPPVYVRIRPTTDVGGHAQTGSPAAAKKLHGWTDDSVTVGWTCSSTDDMGRALKEGEGDTYRYPKKVFGPEATQNDVYSGVVPPLLDKMLGTNGEAATDVMCFAYGQTATGKTHTMLGPDASLDLQAPTSGVHDQWGIFPRMVYDVWHRLVAAGSPFVVSMSAAEFYLCVGNDLLAENMPLAMTSDTQELVGLKQVVLEAPGDVVRLLARARRRRHTRSTAMNLSASAGQANDAHSGSSRSHAALILTAYRVVPGGRGGGTNILRTAFHLVDLAGAERPDSVGTTRLSGTMAWMEVQRAVDAKREVSRPVQTLFINYELYLVGELVITATDANKKCGSFRTKSTMSTQAVRYIGSCFGGQAHSAMLVTLSQAPQCGWETWFSCKYGLDLSKLRYPSVPKKPFDLAEAIATAHRDIATHSAALVGKWQESKVGFLRFSLRNTQRQNLSVFRRLCDKFPDTIGKSVIATSLGETFNVPKPSPIGYTCPRGLVPARALTGEWSQRALSDFLDEEALFSKAELKEFLSRPIREQRKTVHAMIDDVVSNPTNAHYLAAVPPFVETHVDTRPFAPSDNARLRVFVFVPPGHAPDDVRPVLVYCHGGGGVFCEARHYHSHCARYALENNIVVANVEYRLAPEHKAPAGIFDVVGLVLHMAEHGCVGSSGVRVDPARIAVAGDSGGGYIAGGCAIELALRGREDALKLCIPICPMASDIFLRNPSLAERMDGADRVQMQWQWVEDMLSAPKGATEKHYVWLNRVPKECAMRLPPIALITSEFDFCRRMAEDFAARVEGYGSTAIVEYVVHPGYGHVGYSDMTVPGGEVHWGDVTALLKARLL